MQFFRAAAKNGILPAQTDQIIGRPGRLKPGSTRGICGQHGTGDPEALGDIHRDRVRDALEKFDGVELPDIPVGQHHFERLVERDRATGRGADDAAEAAGGKVGEALRGAAEGVGQRLPGGIVAVEAHPAHRSAVLAGDAFLVEIGSGCRDEAVKVAEIPPLPAHRDRGATVFGKAPAEGFDAGSHRGDSTQAGNDDAIQLHAGCW